MQENYELVQKGFRILVTSMSGYIGQEFHKKYKENWWNEVITSLHDQRDLPLSGNYGELIDSLDIANCIRLIQRRWNEVFRELFPKNCRTWATELMWVRNVVSHMGQQDLDFSMAERALNTMYLLCKEIDADGAKDIEKLYLDIRKKSDVQYNDVPKVIYAGAKQPESESKRGVLKEGSLLQLLDTDYVQKTTLTRKVTYAGKTIAYPVYKVRLDMLFYNDQNDRIATWITQYEEDNGKDSLQELDKDIYNCIIENFIVESNTDAIIKTQKNIALVGQREPGVTLSDGRIVDGNRRYTCLRRIQREKKEPLYFETVIMDMDIHADRKQIKLLELAIQHGEESKVGYDLIDYAVGTYRDVIQTELLTAEEYAASTNETVAEVKKRIEVAKIIVEFLEYIHLPEQYHIARELQVYSLFQEMMAPLKRLKAEDKKILKQITFHNVILKAVPDQRKFIRNIKGLISAGTYPHFFERQEQLESVIKDKISKAKLHSKEDIDHFAEDNTALAEDIQISMEKALQSSRMTQLKAKPIENINKSISMMLDIDPRLFVKLEDEEKEELKTQMEELSKIIERFRKML